MKAHRDPRDPRQAHLSCGQGRVSFGEPKSAKGRRSVVLTPAALEILNRRRERQREESAMLVGLWEENGLVFPNRLGKPMDHDNIYHRDLKRVRERAGLPPPSAFTISGTASPP